MIDGENIKLLDLYIDESGGSALTESRYRFFLNAAVLLTQSQKELVDLLFLDWRKKYLVNPHKCFHAADFFENYIPHYKKSELSMAKNFNKAVADLIDILNHLTFKANTYYVDLFQLRQRLLLPEPPPYQKNFANNIEKRSYLSAKKQYEILIKNTIGNSKFRPLSLVLKNSFSFHANEIINYQTHDAFNRIIKGYINFESLSGSDTMLVANFHKQKDKIPQDYGDKIVGVNFHTKNSLDGGIELADLIAYISCQTIRRKFKRTSEYPNVPSRVLKNLEDLRITMRNRNNINLINVTNDSI